MTIAGGVTSGVKSRRKKNGKWTRRNDANNNNGYNNGYNNNNNNNNNNSMLTRDKIPDEMYQRYGDALVEILVAKNAHGVAQKRANIEREQSLINAIIARMFGPLNAQQRQQFDIGNSLGAVMKDLRQHEAQCKSLNVAKLSSMVRMCVQVAKDRMQRGVDPCLPLTVDQEIRIMQGKGNDADTEAMLLLMETKAEMTNDEHDDRDSIDADDHKFEPSSFVSQSSLNNTAVNQWLTETYRRGVKRNRVSDGVNADAVGLSTDAKDAENMMKARIPKSSTKKGKKGQDDEGGDAKEEDIISEIVKKRLKERKRQKTEGKTNNSSSSGGGIVMVANRPTTRFSDIGGIESVLDDIRELIEYPFSHPEIYLHLGVEPPRGILLHGPPGSGKTMLAHAIAGELGVPFFKVSAPEVVSGMSGESEKHLRQLFKDAVECAPSLIFIDEIDAITPKRETASREMEKRIVAQLLICMDETSFENTDGKVVMVVGATNRPDALDIGLRRTGRFDREISLGIPDTKARAHILEVMCRKMRLSGEIDFMEIAKLTPGYVGADIQALTKEAAAIAIHRIFSDKNMLAILRQSDPNTAQGEVAMVDDDISDNDTLMQLDGDTNDTSQDGIIVSSRSQAIDSMRLFKQPFTEEQLQHINIEMMDFQEAVKRVQPSAKREGFAMIPDVTWEDIGALEEIRDELRLSIMEPIRNPEKFEKVGLTRPVGVLLFGPPGCGKTLLAKAIANSSGANFISVKGPELLNKYVGESERAVRQVFARASSSAPCVIFFDELDALCPKRGYDSGNASMERVVNQLLTEMDGMDSRKDVFVIAATNRPDIIDPAMLRPGRLDKLLYVPLPNKDERLAILKTLTRKTPLDAMSVDLNNIAIDVRCENFSGADLAALVREASVQCLRQHLDLRAGADENIFKPADAVASSPDMVVTAQHFEEAFARVAPSVSAKDRKMYAALARKVRSNSNRIPSSFGDEAAAAEGKDTMI